MPTCASFHPGRNFRLFALIFIVFAGTARVLADDDTVLAEMKSRILVLQRGIVATSDPAEMVKLQQEIRTVMNETLPKLSPESRPLFAVSMKVIQPLQSLTEQYMREVEVFSTSPQSDPTKIKSPAEFDRQIELLDHLIVRNEEVLKLINSFEDDCQRELTAQGITGNARLGFLDGIQRGLGRQMGPMRAIRTLDTQAYRQMQAIFGYLKQHWGKWKPADTGLAWDDASLEEGFAALYATLQQTIDRQAAAQELLMQRMQGK